MRIALDVEGVLADSHAAARLRSDRLNEDNCPPPDWSFADEDMLDHYLHVTQNLWHNHTEDIKPLHTRLDEATRVLNDDHHVHVVTNRTGVDEQMEAWLDWYEIHREDFTSIGGNKTGVGDFDAFVDDSPRVVEDVIDVGAKIFLIDRPYNQDVEDHPSINRVDSVMDVADRLCQRVSV